MTDQKLIQALRHCDGGDCADCPAYGDPDCIWAVTYGNAADRLEALLAENEQLKVRNTNLKTRNAKLIRVDALRESLVGESMCCISAWAERNKKLVRELESTFEDGTMAMQEAALDILNRMEGKSKSTVRAAIRDAMRAINDLEVKHE